MKSIKFEGITRRLPNTVAAAQTKSHSVNKVRKRNIVECRLNYVYINLKLSGLAVK